mgnify:CR=1 FL=1
MVLYICGRIFYYLGKFEPIEEESLYAQYSLSNSLKLIQTVIKVQNDVNSGKIKVEDA